MKTTEFYQWCVANTYWLQKDHFISIDSYDSSSHVYHIHFDGLNGIQYSLLDLQEISIIVRCIKNSFGSKSFSYIEWNSLLHDIKVNKLLDRIDNPE